MMTTHREPLSVDHATAKARRGAVALLVTTLYGGYPGMPEMDPQARIGFSAHGSVKRSDFGMGFGVPAPGTTMGVGDLVEFAIEAEFNGPPLPASGNAAH
jgi:polyisoprenoid-binding protein YceI